MEIVLKSRAALERTAPADPILHEGRIVLPAVRPRFGRGISAIEQTEAWYAAR